MASSVVQNNSNYGGIGFAGLLTILFVALKLTGVIAWPWVWVLAPLWISFLIWLVVVGAVLWGLWRMTR